MSDLDYSKTVITTHYVQQQQQERIETDLPSLSSVQLDIGYLKTIAGMVKCIAIALDFMCFLCLLVGGRVHFSGAGWAMFVTVTGLTVSLTLLCLYLFRIVDILTQVPWIISEMIFNFAWTTLFFISASVLVVAAARYQAEAGFAAAGFFAFGAMCTYAFDCYLKFLAWKGNEVARGGEYGAPIVGARQRRVTINDY